MKLANAIGKRIQELLFKKNITQYRLAKNACINFKTLSNIINQKNEDVKTSTIFLICNELNISISEFYNSELFNKNNIEI